MERYNKIKDKFRKNSLFCLAYMPCVTFIFLALMLLLCYPDAAASGVKSGIEICLETLVPTLFPFMVLSTLLINLDVLDKISKKMHRFTKFLLGLPGEAFPIILMSFVGGFPVGAFMIKSAYESGKITLSQGRRMLIFCVNPGPAFTVTTIGSVLFGSQKIGIIVYASSVISALLLGIFSRFFDNEDENCYSIVQPETETRSNISSAITKSVNASVHNTVNICVWVVIFSCIGALTDILPLSEKMIFFTKMISEVTNGVFVAAEQLSLPGVCAVIGFSGFCIHLQIMPSLIKLRLRYKYFLVFRIISGALNCVVCFVLMELFPQYVSTFSIGSRPERISSASSVPLCICLMFMCGLFVIGDGYVMNKKNKTLQAGNKAELY